MILILDNWTDIIDERAIEEIKSGNVFELSKARSNNYFAFVDGEMRCSGTHELRVCDSTNFRLIDDSERNELLDFLNMGKSKDIEILTDFEAI